MVIMEGMMLIVEVVISFTKKQAMKGAVNYRLKETKENILSH